jgi:two-component system, OmpR family, copper resistance phosphate regulon response regulator CusR
VEVAADGDAGAKLVNQSQCDLLLLDLTLPRLDGFEVLKRAVEGHREMRILVLSGRSRLEDRVRALDEGADDFLLKPFSLVELTARVRAITRRRGPEEKTTLQVCDLVLDRLRGTVHRSGRAIELTPREFSLLALLAANPGTAVSRARILNEVWKLQSDRPSNIVDVYVNYLRKKIDSGEVNKLVHTIRGVGYSVGVNTTSPLEHCTGMTNGARQGEQVLRGGYSA